MKSVLMLFGAMTFIAGFALGVTEWAGDPALASILSEVEALRADVKKLLQ